MKFLVEALGIVKNQVLNSATIPVLRGIDLRLEKGGFMAVMGASGSGKSTLLNILGCLDRPTAGTYRLDGTDVLGASDDRLSSLRSRHIGFVFQTYNLIPELTVAENVELPFLYQDISAAEGRRRALRAIEQVGLAGRRGHRPSELSGGEMQRTAIARALSIEPKLILADEPTGNLDSQTTREIMQLFKRVHAAGSSIILVTHDPQVAACARSCITISDGRITRESA